jgi:hypothetical protein
VSRRRRHCWSGRPLPPHCRRGRRREPAGEQIPRREITESRGAGFDMGSGGVRRRSYAFRPVEERPDVSAPPASPTSSTNLEVGLPHRSPVTGMLPPCDTRILTTLAGEEVSSAGPVSPRRSGQSDTCPTSEAVRTRHFVSWQPWRRRWHGRLQPKQWSQPSRRELESELNTDPRFSALRSSSTRIIGRRKASTRSPR